MSWTKNLAFFALGVAATAAYYESKKEVAVEGNVRKMGIADEVTHFANKTKRVVNSKEAKDLAREANVFGDKLTQFKDLYNETFGQKEGKTFD